MEKLAVEKSDFSHMEFSQSDAGEYEIPAKKSKRMRDAPIRYRDDEDVIEGRLLAHRGNKNKEKSDERRVKASKENFNMLPKPLPPLIILFVLHRPQSILVHQLVPALQA